MREAFEMEWPKDEGTIDLYLPATMDGDMAGDVMEYTLKTAEEMGLLEDRTIALTLDGSMVISLEPKDNGAGTKIWKRLVKIQNGATTGGDITWD